MLRYKINPALNNKIGDDGRAYIHLDLNIGCNFSFDAMQDMLSDDMFFNKVKKDVIPPITDMEKIVVYPAVYGGDSPEDGEPMLSLADEIEINMHFRRRWVFTDNEGKVHKEEGRRTITDGWMTSDPYYWNMHVKGKDGDPKDEAHMPDPFPDILEHREKIPDGYDEQSDLVGYLGFDDDDIYYQKTKVKKSFLRLMYYDSNDLTNKNLLTYSTSFLDSGKMFTKYAMIRNNAELYRELEEMDDGENRMALFEPGEVDGYGKYDKFRLSTRITLKSKYHDDASSDGFYLYMFKQDAPGESPYDLYLKAEFNNAKYGKTVNMMLPVGEDGVPLRLADSGFPTDFVIKDCGTTDFDFSSYYNSLFVNVKYKYDKKLKKYIYYFPWDPTEQIEKMEDTGKKFSVSNDVEKRKITINLWEPRLNSVVDMDKKNNTTVASNGRN